MAIFKTVDKIPLAFIRMRGGALVTGLSVTVKVINVITGATLLATTSLSEVTPGVYSYNWNHTLTAFTECVAIYTVGTNNYTENFSVDESTDINERINAKTV